jgi:PIN domain nuclease of toxin-antitoxin system
MRVLLDTHALYWWRADPDRLTPAALAAIRDRSTPVFVSAASVWELSIKAHTRGWEAARVLLLDVEEYLRAQGMLELPMTCAHARDAGSLPLVHRDPFDRMLIAQARVERMRLISNEALFDRYGVSRIW